MTERRGGGSGKGKGKGGVVWHPCARPHRGPSEASHDRFPGAELDGMHENDVSSLEEHSPVLQARLDLGHDSA